jgi:hypothetical protein
VLPDLPAHIDAAAAARRRQAIYCTRYGFVAERLIRHQGGALTGACYGEKTHRAARAAQWLISTSLARGPVA